MNLRALLASICLLAFAPPIHAQNASGPTEGESAPTKPTKKKKVKKPKGTRVDMTELEKGLPGETIRQLLGKPQEIRSVESSEGKAEVWVYRRVVGRRVKQVSATTTQVPTFDSRASDGMGTTTEVNSEMQRIVIYQTIRITMVNDQLVAARQSIEQDGSFE